MDHFHEQIHYDRLACTVYL